MSRYVILTEDENLEVMVGFDEGFERFFLTIGDARICTGEAGTYLFHNMDHHPGVGMTLGEVTATLERFGMTLPPDLTRQLEGDAVRYGAANAVIEIRATPALITKPNQLAAAPRRPGEIPLIRVLNWQAI